MGKSAPAPPPPVDTSKMISEQANANKDTAQYQQQLNMVGSQGPTGSVKYSKDPTQPGGYTQITELSPEQQALYKLGVDAQTGAVGIANDQLGRISTSLGQGLNTPTLQTSVGPTDFTADREAITDAVWNRAKSRLDPNWSQAEDRNRTRLSNQGLSQNSTAYRGAMDDFGRSRNDAYDQALSSAILAGSDQQNTLFNQAMAQGNFGNAAKQQGFQNDALARSQPINDFQALLGTGQIQLPGAYQGPTTGVAGTDVMGAYGLNSQQQQNAYNARVGNINSQNSGVAQLGSAALMAAIMSDIRTKKDIQRIGSADGHALYVYRYIGEPETAPLRLGVMAQEVAATRPDAVIERPDGILTVDYARLFGEAA